METILIIIFSLLALLIYYVHGKSEYFRGKKDMHDEILDIFMEDKEFAKKWNQWQNERLRRTNR